MPRLEGKTAIVTGATGGIGHAIAALFVQEGGRVLLVDREKGLLRRLREELGSQTAYFPADVSNPRDAEAYVQEAVQRFGGVDSLIANAGIEGTVRPLTTLCPEQFDRVMEVNVRGVFLGIKYALPELAKRRGSIIVMSSIAGLQGSPGLAAYVASKHAALGLMRCAALEAAPQGVRVNALCPGPVDNRMMRGIEGQIAPGHADDVKRRFEAQIPLGRYGTNAEIAQLALYLASDDASYCTGGVFIADGGFTVQ
jgi:NAD(P)-dependent dehydrogenase (short-subunit alcohol dehydrogenase family)